MLNEHCVKYLITETLEQPFYRQFDSTTENSLVTSSIHGICLERRIDTTEVPGLNPDLGYQTRLVTSSKQFCDDNPTPFWNSDTICNYNDFKYNQKPFSKPSGQITASLIFRSCSSLAFILETQYMKLLNGSQYT